MAGIRSESDGLTPTRTLIYQLYLRQVHIILSYSPPLLFLFQSSRSLTKRLKNTRHASHEIAPYLNPFAAAPQIVH